MIFALRADIRHAAATRYDGASGTYVDICHDAARYDATKMRFEITCCFIAAMSHAR